MSRRIAIPLRIAPELHARLKELAGLDGRSMNTFIGRILSHYVARTPAPGVSVLPVPSRVRKARPNEPCPCGSGAKYKRCHGAVSPNKS